MKYINIYESFDTGENIILSIKLYDLVILINANRYTKKENFIVGNIYEIAGTDESDNLLPYCIGKIGDVGHSYNFAWVNANQIRKATQLEIDANKYNLCMMIEKNS